jgi:hypothetical protein
MDSAMTDGAFVVVFVVLCAQTIPQLHQDNSKDDDKQHNSNLQ